MPRVLSKLLGLGALDAVVDGTRVHAYIENVGFSPQSPPNPNQPGVGPPPYSLGAIAVIKVDGVPVGQRVKFAALLGWVHADGTGVGYGGAWQPIEANNNDVFTLQTPYQFSDASGTQFQVQVHVQGVVLADGTQLSDQVTTQPAPAATGGGYQAFTQTGPGQPLQPFVPPTQPVGPQPQPIVGAPTGGGWYPGSLIVQLIQGLFGGGTGSGG